MRCFKIQRSFKRFTSKNACKFSKLKLALHSFIAASFRSIYSFKKKNNSTYEECHADQKLHNSNMHVCHEVHLKVVLQTKSDGIASSKEFYYPSNCVCELVKLKKAP